MIGPTDVVLEIGSRYVDVGEALDDLTDTRYGTTTCEVAVMQNNSGAVFAVSLYYAGILELLVLSACILLIFWSWSIGKIWIALFLDLKMGDTDQNLITPGRQILLLTMFLFNYKTSLP